MFESEKKLLEVQKQLNESDIIPRRYFYPSLNTLPYVKNHSMPVSENTAKCILCLPLYVGLNEKDLKKIIEIINKLL